MNPLLKKILHIGSERSWRGGENQVHLLASHSKKFEYHMAYPEGAKALEVMGAGFSVCPLASSKSYDFRNSYRLKQYCRNHGIHILNAQSSVALDWALKVKKSLPELKIVFHRRVAFPMKKNYFSQKKYLSHLIDASVGISDFIVQQMFDYGIAKESLHLVHSAVVGVESVNKPAESQQWKARLNIPEGAKLLGLVGAMTWEKGHDIAIKAFSLLKNENLHLVFAGEGRQRIEIENYAEGLGLSSRVHFLGHIQDVPSLLAALDILLVPSRQEGLGSVVLDAMLRECFVVASDAGGLPEMIKDGHTGYLFESGNSEQMAKKMIKALEVYNTNEFQAKAKQYVETHFSLQAMVEGNEEIYGSVLG